MTITIPADHEVQPVDAIQATDPVTCGTCGLTWDDAIVTGITPAPAARCPFEPFHVEDDIPVVGMLRKRAIMIVEVDCDSVPGAFHTPEDHRERLEHRLQQMYPWYNPTVTLQSTIVTR